MCDKSQKTLCAYKALRSIRNHFNANDVLNWVEDFFVFSGSTDKDIAANLKLNDVESDEKVDSSPDPKIETVAVLLFDTLQN